MLSSIDILALFFFLLYLSLVLILKLVNTSFFLTVNGDDDIKIGIDKQKTGIWIADGDNHKIHARVFIFKKINNTPSSILHGICLRPLASVVLGSSLPRDPLWCLVPVECHKEGG